MSNTTRIPSCVLRYVGGYVCHKVCNKLKSSTLENRHDLILCVHDMCSHEVSEDEGTEHWLNAIDRGGLWHINDQTYSLFYTFEELILEPFKRNTAHKLINDDSKLSLITTLQSSVIQWCMLTASTDDADATAFLNQFIELYVTIRGFSFASSCVELYKVIQESTGNINYNPL